ncbi:hypothetical protein VitviT2T_007246 [Vitis vinifera]|uniref:Rho GDP-dissociation inhibitor 1 n=2 Tax=Vitis vinifera TaxID=29760 RepID=F6I4G3_VITVI|nr:rho GDP-dissociation inhibitor 1 isoform X2 [Vitis vinifera]XP_034685540.1 rho GDP-dissociation inhibitor 1-like isoform X2 [Vitis riparia]RVW31129.1 Rho GDP-dissociation inhibitor 1 [Vitis vinifera]WJZ87899.1 hypothetical protein VitviT2T_007246 [Vitis vinifera]|eukprot:XP_002263904.1 PREDICTED: rho GDP-dissociation inhibitor 1 isoform X2 [Vitis vinifera]
MSALVGAISKDFTFNPVMEKEENKDGEPTRECDDSEKPDDEGREDDEDDEAEEDGKPKSEKELENKELELGPQVSLKEQLEKDKDDESLRRWKEQLLGTVDFSAVGESNEPEVRIQSLSILCKDRPDLVFAIPLAANSKDRLFTLKEGSRYHLKFSFVVSNNIVSGLKYIHTVWKTGIKVDNTRIMLGTFSPQQEPYTYELEEETTPSGMFARGSYSARSKFIDDDRKCYLDFSYTFDIQKNWPSAS